MQRVTYHFYGKKKKLITFKLITFAVYEREQNLCPKFERSHIQCKIIDSEIKTLPDWYKFYRWFLALSRFSPFIFSLMEWQEKKNHVDKFPTLHHGAFSTNAPTLRRILTVMWKIKYDIRMSITKASIKFITFFPLKERQRQTDIFYPTFKAVLSNLRKCISALYV